MEIEKKRETSWKIALNNKEKNIELTSVEIGGEVRIIKFSLIKGEQMITVEMSKEEFFNFLSLLNAFKDVVIGEDLTKREQHSEYYEKPINSKNAIQSDEEHREIEADSSNIREKDEKLDLDPEEWDPW